MKFALGAVLIFGLGLVGLAGVMFVNQLDANPTSVTLADIPELDVTQPAPSTVFEANWIYRNQDGFLGEVTLTSPEPVVDPQTQDTASVVTFPIEYPSAFAGGLSALQMDQSLSGRELVEIGQANGLEYLGCFNMDSGTALTQNRDLHIGFSNYNVCRVTSLGDAEPVQAIIGYLHPGRNKQPIDLAAERCAAEAAIWLNQFAVPGTPYAICMIIMDEVESRADLIVFERVDGAMIVRSSQSVETGTAFALDGMRSRSSENIARFEYFQAWSDRQDELNPIRTSFYTNLPTIGEKITARAQTVDLSPFFEFENVSVFDEFIRIHLRSSSDVRVDAQNRRGARTRDAVFKLLCSDPMTAAFLDLQQLETVLEIRLVSEDGSMMLDGRHTEMPCNSWRE